jgi:hypothetical protein
MEILEYRTADYHLLVDAWKAHGWELAPPPEFLPRHGYVARDGDLFIAALFAYIEPGTIAYVAWPASNVEATDEQRAKAFELLFAKLKSKAIELGCKFMYGATAVGAYKKLMQGWGFIPVETNLQSYVYPFQDTDMDFLKD